MTLLLIRHAESSGNSTGRIQGWSDAALTAAGVAQAAALARRLATLRLDAIYASPLSRAHDTARSIAEVAGLNVTLMDGLRERFYGQAQGLTWDQAALRWPAEASHHDDWAAKVPEVESIPALRDRAVAAVSEVLDRHDGGLAVCVSHGGTIAQIVGNILGLPVGVWPRVRLSNTSVTVIDGTSAAPVLRALNDICHLSPEQRRVTLAL